jgi:alkylation response protein AidB-like acyl-CoA dehydrogenase
VLAVLSEEQQMLRDMMAQLSASIGLTTTGDLATVDRTKAWHRLSEAGLLGLRIRDEKGVPAGSGVEHLLIAEALGGSVAPLPFLGSVLAADLLALAGAPVEWLKDIAAGEVRYALLLTPDLSGLADVADILGSVAWDADEVAYAVGVTRSPGLHRVVRVSMTPGFSPVESADLTRRLARATNRAGPDQAEAVGASLSPEQQDRWLALALTLVCGDVAGVMRSGLDDAVAYTKDRIQYGVPVGSFQAVQHMCAECLVQTEAAAATARYAAWAVDALDPPEALMAARTAKAYCSSAARGVTETIMQVYGGIGHTWEHLAHVRARRALMDRQVLGDECEQLLRIADWRLASHPAG